MNICNLFKRKKSNIREKILLLEKYEKEGYHVERIDLFDTCFCIFSKDFNEGDEIYWLGHDNVFGLMHGKSFIADKEAVEKKNKLSFWKKIDEINLDNV